MSIGFNKSYQCAGLNRVGVYLTTAREKGPESARTQTAVEKPNELWRRYTGIFPGVKLERWQRKRGLKILAKRIQQRVQQKLVAEPQRREYRRPNEEVRVSLVEAWDIDSETWARAQNCGITVEALCVELGCPRHVLTALLKEHCAVNAGEFLDGLKIVRLKAALMERLREAASELWGYPGSYVAVKLMNGGLSQRREGAKNGKNGGGKRSKYFVTRPEELFEESRGEERARRVSAICAMLRSDFDLESWTVRCGYESGAKLKLACLNVFGRTLAQLERVLAGEVVQFYLCAEDRELREIALRDDGSVIVGRARELYQGDDAKPVAPFEDEWAKFEELKAEWLSRMWQLFN